MKELLSILLLTAATAQAQTAIDLGLPSGTKWADRNIGASSPADFGNYYMWGNITPDTSESATNGKTIPTWSNDPTYDAATASYGSSWSTPTKEQLRELCNPEYCHWEWTSTPNSEGAAINGFKISSTRPGYAQNSIFIPAAGFLRNGEYFYRADRAFYWSASPFEFYANCAYYLYFYSDYHTVDNYHFRTDAFPIRPVKL